MDSPSVIYKSICYHFKEGVKAKLDHEFFYTVVYSPSANFANHASISQVVFGWDDPPECLSIRDYESNVFGDVNQFSGEVGYLVNVITLPCYL